MLEKRLFIYLFVQMWNKAMYVKSCFLTLTYDKKKTNSSNDNPNENNKWFLLL
jgi:hypothetical protein